jgi:alkanesulfonate monooxygenase SsuD/methylene tetrahydromethanopterin reductase-like flavin-dependent oxidoreductase (luciferase family)
MQASSSPRGREFAARWAEAIFCTSGSKKDAVEFYADIKGRMDRLTRRADGCAICTSATVVLGETESIACEKAEYLTSLVPLEMVLATNSAMLGADLSKTKDEDELTETKATRVTEGWRTASTRRCVRRASASTKRYGGREI